MSVGFLSAYSAYSSQFNVSKYRRYMVDTYIIAAEKEAHYSVQNFVKSLELVGFENKTSVHYLISYS